VRVAVDIAEQFVTYFREGVAKNAVNLTQSPRRRNEPRPELHVPARRVRMPFERLALQRELASRGQSWLVLVEHPPVFTIGKNGDASNVLPTRTGSPWCAIDRGGDVTYHGPGQLVGYPIAHSAERRIGIREHVLRIERALIAALGGSRGAGADPEGIVGLWTDRGKIASGRRARCPGVTTAASR